MYAVNLADFALWWFEVQDIEPINKYYAAK